MVVAGPSKQRARTSSSLTLEDLRLYSFCPLAFDYRRKHLPYKNVSRDELFLRIVHRLLKDAFVSEALGRGRPSPKFLREKASCLWARYFGYAPGVCTFDDVSLFHDLVTKVFVEGFGEVLAVDHIFPASLGQEEKILVSIDLITLQGKEVHGILFDPMGFYLRSPLNVFRFERSGNYLAGEFPSYKTHVHFMDSRGNLRAGFSSMKNVPDVIANLARGIKNNIIFPRSHPTVCAQCYYTKICPYS